MDFEPAPAGVAGAALLAHRGADHEVVSPAGHSFYACLQNAFQFTPVAAGAHTLPYSETGGVGVRLLFTRDAAVLQLLLGHGVVAPTRIQTAWAYATANGLNAAIQWTDLDDSHARIDAWLSTVSMAAIPAALLVTAADIYDTDQTVLAAGIGGAASLWRRSALISGVASEVEGVAGLYSLKDLAWFYYVTPGIFLPASRDTTAGGSMTRVLDMCQGRADRARMPAASLPTLQPAATARAVASYFRLSVPPVGWRLLGGSLDAGAGAGALRRMSLFAVNAALSVSAGAPVEDVTAFRGVLESEYYLVITKLPAFAELVGSGASVQQGLSSMQEVANWGFAPAREMPACLPELIDIERLVERRLTAMRAANLSTRENRLMWLRESIERERGAPASGTVGAAPGGALTTAVAGGAMANALMSADVMATVAAGVALLAALPVDKVALCLELAKSRLPILATFGRGIVHPQVAARTLPLHAAEMHRFKEHVTNWVTNLSHHLVSPGVARVLTAREQQFVVDHTAGEHIRRFRLTLGAKAAAEGAMSAAEADGGQPVGASGAGMTWSPPSSHMAWLQLAYLTEGVRTDTVFVPPAASIAFTQLEHYDVMTSLLERVDSYLGASVPGNTLSGASIHARIFFSKFKGLASVAPDAAKAARRFYDRLFYDVECEWAPLFASHAAAFDKLPAALVSPAAACFSVVTEADRDYEMEKALLRSSSRFRTAMGVSDEALSYAAGMGPSGSTWGGESSSAGRAEPREGRARSRSRSRSPSVERGAASSSSRRDGGGERARDPVSGVWRTNATDFSYTRDGEVVVPQRHAKKLGVRVNAVCWETVCSRKPKANDRIKYCPKNGKCGKSHKQTEEIRALVGGGHFEGGRDMGVTGRDLTSSAKGKSSVDARKRAKKVEAEVRRDGPAKRDARSRSRSPPPRTWSSPSDDDVDDEDDVEPDDDEEEEAEDGAAEGDDGGSVEEASGARSILKEPSVGRGGKGRGGKGGKGKGGRGGRGKGRGKGRGRAAGRGAGRGARVAFAAGAARGAAQAADSVAPQPVATGNSIAGRLVGAAARGTSALLRTARRCVGVIPTASLGSAPQMLLLVVALVTGEPPSVVLPEGGGLFGRATPASWVGVPAQAKVASLANEWTASLVESREQAPPAFYAAARGINTEAPMWMAVAVTSRRVRLAGSNAAGVAGVWVDLPSLSGRPEYVPAAVAAYRASSYLHSVSLAGDDPWLDSGSVECAETALAPGGAYSVGKIDAQPLLGANRGSFARETRSFAEMQEVALQDTASLRQTFASCGPEITQEQAKRLEASLVAGFAPPGSARPLEDAVAAVEAMWKAECGMWRDRITPPCYDSMPAALKETGALASFEDDELALLPFASRCKPPVTKPRPPPSLQSTQAAKIGPEHVSGFFPPGHFQGKADPYLCGMRAFLRDVLENGESATAEQPDQVSFGQAEFLPEYRGGLYEFVKERGRFELTDHERRPRTHLNLAFAHTFRVGYDDQEMFSTLDFGVVFGARLMELQLVLPRHLQSIAGGLATLHKDLSRRLGLGWYDVFDQVPKCPWRPQQVGHRKKRLGGGRLIVNGSHPHSPMADDGGVLIHSLNALSKASDDVTRGSDGARMGRLIRRLRTTCGSPPPASRGAVDADVCTTCDDVAVVPPTDRRRDRLGKVSVVHRADAGRHPWSVWGGRRSLLGNPLIMKGEEERAAVCGGFRVLLQDSSLSPYVLARRLGLGCHPTQARVAHTERATYMSALAAGVARGRSLQLVCACAPLACHLDHVAAIIRQEAKQLWLRRLEAPARMPRGTPTVLILFSGPGERADSLHRYLRDAGFDSFLVDTLVRRDLLDAELYGYLHSRARAGGFVYVVAGIPCHTFSFGRHREEGRIGSGGARPIRDRRAGAGPLPWCTEDERVEIARSDKLIKRTCAIICAAFASPSRAGYLIENPVDREDGEFAWPAQSGGVPHCPLWVHTQIVMLRRATGAKTVDFAQCQLEGAWYQKMTTFMYAPASQRVLASLVRLRCRCAGHRGVAVGFDEVGGSRSEQAAAWPRGANKWVAFAIVEYAGERRPRHPVGHRLVVLEAELSAADDPPKRPPELKWFITEYMHDGAILKHVARKAGLRLVSQSDDFKDWFYQLALAPSDEWLVGFIVLELNKVAAQHPELRFMAERVLAQGTVPGSNEGQRHCELCLHMWDVVFEVLSAPVVDKMRRENPELEAWWQRRLAAGLEARLHCRAGYTDDTRWQYVGDELALCGSKAWAIVTHGYRTMMAEARKRQLGLHDVSLGTHFDNTLGVAYLEADKVARSIEQLVALRERRLPASDYRSLLGLLVHVSFLADMSPAAMHGMFNTLAVALERGPSTVMDGDLYTRDMDERAAEWINRLRVKTGSPFTAAIAPWAPMRMCTSRRFWRSDACKEGTDHPGIAGVQTPEVWVRPLRGAETELPVPVTEFVGYIGNFDAYGHTVDDGDEIVSEIDALTPAYVLTREHSSSELMQVCLRTLKQMPSFQRLRDQVKVGHLFGEANKMGADLPSRGRVAELADMMSHADVELQVRRWPPIVDRLLEELVRRHARIANRRFVRASTSMGMHNPNLLQSPFAHISIEPPRSTPWMTDGRKDATVQVSAPRGRETAAIPALVISVAMASAAATRPTPAEAAIVLPPMSAAANGSAMESVTTFVSSMSDHDGPRVCPPVVGGKRQRETDYVSEATRRMLNDESHYALRPRDPSALAGMVRASSSAGTAKGAKMLKHAHWKMWLDYTNEMGTPAWRPDWRDLDAAGRERESVLYSGFVRRAHATQKGRGGRARAKPESAYKAYLHVRRVHKEQRHVDLMEAGAVHRAVKEMCFDYLEEFGGDSLIIRRKLPFNNRVWKLLFERRGQTGGLDLDDAKTRVAFHAFAATLRQTGMRKSELVLVNGQEFTKRHARRSNLEWHLRGVRYSTPPEALLRDPRDGDYARLTPPVSKADQKGEVWGSLPIYLHFESRDPQCAFCKLAELEMAMPVAGRMRREAPLISPDGERPFTGAVVDGALKATLTVLGSAAADYSWHSARIYLACALLASHASGPQIQALCRWQSEESLRIYARLEPKDYRALLNGAAHASDLESVTTTACPQISGEQIYHDLLGVSRADAVREEEEIEEE